jgi:hypothetical protein
MAYWLFKSEPFKWSWEMQKAKGAAGEQWDGIRNYQARNNMRAMKLGDKGFFYHSNEGLEVVGIVEVCELIHPDTTTDDPRWECVDIRAVCDMPKAGDAERRQGEPEAGGNESGHVDAIVGPAGDRGGISRSLPHGQSRQSAAIARVTPSSAGRW